MMRRGNYRISLLTTIIFLLLFLSFIAVSCEPIAPFRITNHTDQTLTIFIEDRKIGDVAPGKEIKNRITLIMNMTAGKYHIEAKDKEGNSIYSEEFTYQEISNMDWEITIPAISDNHSLRQ
jgi:hypothetical protein